jgi:hypothetical protein
MFQKALKMMPREHSERVWRFPGACHPCRPRGKIKKMAKEGEKMADS